MIHAELIFDKLIVIILELRLYFLSLLGMIEEGPSK